MTWTLALYLGVYEFTAQGKDPTQDSGPESLGLDISSITITIDPSPELLREAVY